MVSEIKAKFEGWITDEGLFGIFHLETDHKYIDINSMLKSLTILEQKALIQCIQINIKNQKARHDIEVDGKLYRNTYLFINDKIDQYHEYGIYLQILLTKNGEILDAGFYAEKDIDIGGMFQ